MNTLSIIPTAETAACCCMPTCCDPSCCDDV